MKTTTKKRFTPSKKQQEARDERRSMAAKAIDESIKSLVEELKSGKSEHYLEWMKFASQFHRYSSANMWLIMDQARRRNTHPSYIASYKAWEEKGYSVRKGEKAFWIWAPRPYTTQPKKDEVFLVNGNEEGLETHVGFVLVPVFDASQIAQGFNEETGEQYKPLQSFFTPLPEDEEARHLYETLQEVARQDGFTCIEETRTDTVQGWSREKTICIRSGRDSLSTLYTMIHEYAHGLLHWDGIERSQKQKECEAESVAYIVAQHFGLRNPFTSDYLINWGNDEKSLMEYMNRIRATAHDMIEKLEKALDGSSEPTTEKEEVIAA